MKAILYVIIFILSWGMHIQYNDITPVTLQSYIPYHVI
jgi:hypothetical protein